MPKAGRGETMERRDPEAAVSRPPTTVHARSGAAPRGRPEAVGLGCVLGLVGASVALELAVDQLDWTLYTLVQDLRWAAIGLWAALLLWAGLAAASGAVRRLELLRPLGGAPRPRAVRRVWAAGLALAALLVLLPWLVPVPPRGLSLRGGQAWGSAAPGVPATRVRGLQLDGAERRARAMPVALTGWIFAPVSGAYHFRLAAAGDARLEIDGAPLLGLGEHQATIETRWATDPDGARRAETRLGAGFHRIAVFYRTREDAPRLSVRWTPPLLTRYRQVPVRYLLPDDTSTRARRGRAGLLTGARLGIVTLVVLLMLRLGAGVASRLARARGGAGTPPRPPPLG